jgi:hypothetical protein
MAGSSVPIIPVGIYRAGDQKVKPSLVEPVETYRWLSLSLVEPVETPPVHN